MHLKKDFPSASVKKQKKMIKRNLKFLSYLKNRKKSLKKRKKRFLKSDKNQQDLFESYIIADFMKNCLQHE